MGQVLTLDDCVRRFVEERSVSLAPTTLASDYGQLLKWVARCPITTPSEGRQVMTWVLRQQPQKSALKVARYLRSFYRWAASDDVGLLPVNPVSSFKFPKKPQEDDDVVVIPAAKIPFVLAALERPAEESQQWSFVATMMLQTGMRTGEVFAIREGDIRGNELLVHQNLTLTHGLKGSTKTNKRRWVPLNGVARGILERQIPVSGFLFPWNRHAYQSFFRDRMQSLHKQGVIALRYRPYDLRHTAISRWLEEGVPVAQVARWAGNSAEVIWKHYAGASRDYAIPTL